MISYIDYSNNFKKIKISVFYKAGVTYKKTTKKLSAEML